MHLLDVIGCGQRDTIKCESKHVQQARTIHRIRVGNVRHVVSNY